MAKGRPQQIIAGCALLASCLMAALLVKAPHSLLVYLSVSTPFVCLFGFWHSYHDLAATLDAANIGELKTGHRLSSTSLNDRAFIMAIFGIFGIGIALAMGFLVGNMSGR